MINNYQKENQIEEHTHISNPSWTVLSHGNKQNNTKANQKKITRNKKCKAAEEKQKLKTLRCLVNQQDDNKRKSSKLGREIPIFSSKQVQEAPPKRRRHSVHAESSPFLLTWRSRNYERCTTKRSKGTTKFSKQTMLVDFSQLPFPLSFSL